MPESPDFDQIAAVFRLDLEEKLSVAMGDSPFRRQFVNHFVGEFVSQLRLVWNARGAADRAALGVELRRAMVEGGGEIRPEQVLTALDR